MSSSLPLKSSKGDLATQHPLLAPTIEPLPGKALLRIEVRKGLDLIHTLCVLFQPLLKIRQP